MQVTELPAEGLKRSYKVTVPAGEIETRVKGRLERLQQTVRMPGFRPGKAPLPLLKKQYGRSVMSEVLEQAVDEGAKKALDEHQLRPALRPQVEIESFDDGKDLEFKIGLEVLPDVPTVDLESIALTRLVAEPDEARIEEGVQNLARARQEFSPLAEPRPVRDGDRVIIDFAGTVDGEPFDGGSGQDLPLTIGSGSMVPGFEVQLVGAESGEAREVRITFPDDYARADLGGKEAVFAVTVNDVQEPKPFSVDDEWAKTLGTEGLDDLRAKLRERFVEELTGVARSRMKRSLLDHLATTYRFPVPEGMVDLEFDAIWKQLTDEMERTKDAFSAEGQREDEARAEYRAIAERRVRLGLLLSDLGQKNEVQVENEELQRAIVREATRFPGQERQVFEYFRNDASALEQLRAPLFEDKVCDLIFSRANVTDEPIAAEALMREPDEPAPSPSRGGPDAADAELAMATDA